MNLERAGIERFAHSFAYDYPLLYGLVAVALAVGAGLLTSAVLGKKAA